MNWLKLKPNTIEVMLVSETEALIGVVFPMFDKTHQALPGPPDSVQTPYPSTLCTIQDAPAPFHITLETLLDQLDSILDPRFS
uniref:Uncharacterized protein n=1 Tax=Sphaerodactylus townsendi TaxID=933632 RepID=A0ACB8FDJ9_9SAUR